MAASTGEDTQTIEEVYEPYLMQIGYTSDAPWSHCHAIRLHLGFTLPNEQLSLLP